MINVKIDKNLISIASIKDSEAQDIEFWKAKSPSERFEAIELMRQINFGYDPFTDRLQRLLTITQKV